MFTHKIPLKHLLSRSPVNYVPAVKFNDSFSILNFFHFSVAFDNRSLPPLWNTLFTCLLAPSTLMCFGCFIGSPFLVYIANSPSCLWIKCWWTQVLFPGSLLYPHSLGGLIHMYVESLQIYISTADLCPELQVHRRNCSLDISIWMSDIQDFSDQTFDLSSKNLLQS